MIYHYLDMHCDTIFRSITSGSSEIYDGNGMQSIKKMQRAGQMCQFFAVFFPQINMYDNMQNDEEFWKTAVSNLKYEVKSHSDIIAMAKNASEIRQNYINGKMSAVLTIEDGRFVNGDMEKLKTLKEEGVCAISLTWNYANCFGFPNSTDKDIMNSGLTSFGKEAIGVMNDLNIMADVSHLSDGGFWDVVGISKKPVVATHSNCRELSPHPRNLTDDMIRALANNGGVAGVNFAPQFLSKDVTCMKSKVKDIAEHIFHFIKIGGEDCVGLGTDFDGIDGDFEIGDPLQMEKLFDVLIKKGITSRQLDKLSKENVLRIMS